MLNSKRMEGLFVPFIQLVIIYHNDLNESVYTPYIKDNQVVRLCSSYERLRLATDIKLSETKRVTVLITNLITLFWSARTSFDGAR